MKIKGKKYEFVIKMIDWYSMMSTTNSKIQLRGSTITKGMKILRETMTEAVADIIFYLN
jgi:hypothetical protein